MSWVSLSALYYTGDALSCGVLRSISTMAETEPYPTSYGYEVLVMEYTLVTYSMWRREKTTHSPTLWAVS